MFYLLEDIFTTKVKELNVFKLLIFSKIKKSCKNSSLNLVKSNYIFRRTRSRFNNSNSLFVCPATDVFSSARLIK